MSAWGSIKQFFTGKSKRTSMAKGRKRAKKAKKHQYTNGACFKKGSKKKVLRKGCRWLKGRKHVCTCSRPRTRRKK